jgi:N-acetylglucosamine-6-phosphate deacetylase
MILHARHYATGEPVAVTVENGRVTAVGPSAESPRGWVAPAFFDPQINGCHGISFNSTSLIADQVRMVADTCRAHGIGSFCPTLITAGFEPIRHGFATLEAARAADPDLARAIPGYHLEGPYLSGEDGPRGAHPLDCCKDPDWDEFQSLQEAAGGMIRLVTLAPERTGAISFIEKAVAQDVRIAIGHTAATREQILAAVEAGATLSTHLGNAAHDRIQRHHNYLFDQLGEDRLAASLIVDGHHLPPHVVRIFLRAKGLAQTILVSDAVMYAGMPPGVYDAGHRQFEVGEDRSVRVVGEPRLAGSGLLLLEGVNNLVRFAGVSLEEAFRTATAHPARFLGLYDRLGSLEPGREASFILFRSDGELGLRVVETIVAGRSVFLAR